MNFSPETRSILQELERRKATREDPCESCDGSGYSANSTTSQPLACGHCLGQGVLLTEREHSVLMDLAGLNDNVLGAEIIH